MNPCRHSHSTTPHAALLLCCPVPVPCVGPMGPAGPPLLFCPFQVVWKVTVGVCSTQGHIQTVAECPTGTFLMSSACAGYKKGCTPPQSPAVGAEPNKFRLPGRFSGIVASATQFTVRSVWLPSWLPAWRHQLLVSRLAFWSFDGCCCMWHHLQPLAKPTVARREQCLKHTCTSC